MHTEILSRPDAATSLLVAIVFHITAGLFNELFAPTPIRKSSRPCFCSCLPPPW